MAILEIFFNLISFLCYLIALLIIARSVLSWVWPRPTNMLMIYLHKVTEPFLAPLRRIIPRTGMVDLSPLLAILILYLISAILNRIF